MDPCIGLTQVAMAAAHWPMRDFGITTSVALMGSSPPGADSCCTLATAPLSSGFCSG